MVYLIVFWLEIVAKWEATVAFERILVVDDNQFSRKSLVSQILDFDYEVYSVGSGAEAVNLLERDDFDLVLTRLTMPVVDGWTLLESTKNLPRHNRKGASGPPPFVYTTPNFDPEIEERARHAGFSSGLAKPIEPAQLRVAIKKGLSQREDSLRIDLSGGDATLLQSLSDRFSMEPDQLVALLVEEISLCGFGEEVKDCEDLRSFLLTHLRGNLLFLPQKVA